MCWREIKNEIKNINNIKAEMPNANKMGTFYYNAIMRYRTSAVS